ncbi:MAG: GNAT family N-acetyltransferase [Acidimicrobiales bacterium]
MPDPAPPDTATGDTDEGWVETVLNSDDHRYELWLDDRLIGIAAFRPSPGKIEIHHTEIEPEMEGQGLGGELVAAALDHARASHLKVVPTCSFVAHYIGQHPEYADLVAG